MPLYKVPKFAEMVGMKPKDIHAYVAQNKLVKTKEGYIDTDTIINGTFLTKRQAKLLKRDESEVEELETGMSSTKSEVGAAAKSKDDIYFLDELKGRLLEVNIKKGEIDLEKKHGEVFPIHLVKELTMKLTSGLTMAYKQHMEQQLDYWALKLKIPNAEIVKAIKDLAEGLNKAQRESLEKVKMEMIAIARDYSDKKGIGEHE